MAKKQLKRKQQENQELDGVFILKIVLFVILGSIWLKITKYGSDLTFPVPVGLIIGLLFTTHEYFRVDRKIEYAVLACAALFGYVAPYGLFIKF
jgi:hypothetical protein